jgi:hypothetical protein
MVRFELPVSALDETNGRWATVLLLLDKITTSVYAVSASGSIS